MSNPGVALSVSVPASPKKTQKEYYRHIVAIAGGSGGCRWFKEEDAVCCFFTSEHIFLELSSVGYQKCVTVLVLSLSFCGVQEKQFNL